MNDGAKIPEKSTVKPLDYSRVENWVINANADLNTDYDLIFFCGTSVMKQEYDNGTGLMDEASRLIGYSNYMCVGSQLNYGARVFCPMQRQIALSHALKSDSHDGLLEEIGSKEPYVDLEAALDYYFDNYNKGAKRPFVLAGHSQGAASLQVCLPRYFLLTDKKDYLKSMVAAYSIGYGVSKNYFDTIPNKEGRLHFAKGAGDYNCLISWNTEGPGEKGYSMLLGEVGDKTLVINPLNWKRDETYAGIDENLGVLIKHECSGKPTRYNLSLLNEDLCDAQLDLKRGSVICSTKKDFVNLPVASDGEIWGGKSLHFYDGIAFYNNMRQNVKLRVANFLADKKKDSN